MCFALLRWLAPHIGKLTFEAAIYIGPIGNSSPRPAQNSFFSKLITPNKESHVLPQFFVKHIQNFNHLPRRKSKIETIGWLLNNKGCLVSTYLLSENSVIRKLFPMSFPIVIPVTAIGDGELIILTGISAAILVIVLSHLTALISCAAFLRRMNQQCYLLIISSSCSAIISFVQLTSDHHAKLGLLSNSKTLMFDRRNAC